MFDYMEGFDTVNDSRLWEQSAEEIDLSNEAFDISDECFVGDCCILINWW